MPEQLSLLDWSPSQPIPSPPLPSGKKRRRSRGWVERLVPVQTTKFVVYVLRDPITQAPRYVGVTSNLLERVKKHFYNSHTPEIHTWVTDVVARCGRFPAVQVMDATDSEARATVAESRAVETFREAGHDLLNSKRATSYCGSWIPLVEVRFPDGTISTQRVATNGRQSSHLQRIPNESVATMKIKEIMMNAGITLSCVAAALETSYQNVAFVLSRKYQPSLDMALKMARLFSIDANDFSTPATERSCPPVCQTPTPRKRSSPSAAKLPSAAAWMST